MFNKTLNWMSNSAVPYHTAPVCAVWLGQHCLINHFCPTSAYRDTTVYKSFLKQKWCVQHNREVWYEPLLLKHTIYGPEITKKNMTQIIYQTTRYRLKFCLKPEEINQPTATKHIMHSQMLYIKKFHL